MRACSTVYPYGGRRPDLTIFFVLSPLLTKCDGMRLVLRPSQACWCDRRKTKESSQLRHSKDAIVQFQPSTNLTNRTQSRCPAQSHQAKLASTDPSTFFFRPILQLGVVLCGCEPRGKVGTFDTRFFDYCGQCTDKLREYSSVEVHFKSSGAQFH